MARILCLTTGLTGMLNASFELMRRLERADHTVVYGTHSPVQEQVKVQGFDYIQLPLYKPEYAPTLPHFLNPFQKIKQISYKLFRGQSRRSTALRKIVEDMEQYASILHHESPDLVLIDIELHPFIFKTYEQGIPFALLSQWFNGLESVGLPPLESNFIPTGEKHDSVAIAALQKAQKQKIRRQSWRTSIVNLYSDRRSILLAYAQKVGFPMEYLSHYGWPTPFNYYQFPTLHLQLQELEFPYSPPFNHHYLGLMVNDRRRERKLASVERSRLERLLEYKLIQGKKLILLTMTTMQTQESHFIQKFIQAVGSQPEWIGMISLGGRTTRDLEIDLENKPDNIHCFDYIPQLKVLRHCDCSVNHGGIHTINECIHFGVPMLIYSGRQFDQDGCAARMKYHALAELGDRLQDTPDMIQQKISRVMSNSALKENLQNFKFLNDSLGYQNRLPQLIDHLLHSEANT